MQQIDEMSQKIPKQKTILVVEDDNSIGQLLVEALSQETPYRTIWVTNGLRALQTARAIKPNLFITDYRLPFMNGIELYDRLHATRELAHMPTIIMSASLPKAEVQKRHMISMSKPFELDDFLNTVEMMLQ